MFGSVSDFEFEQRLLTVNGGKTVARNGKNLAR